MKNKIYQRLFVVFATIIGLLGATVITANAQQYLKVFSPNEYQTYMNAPQVSGNTVILRNDQDTCPNCYHTGVGVLSNLPAYQTGDVLQWAVLARTTTSPQTTLNIGVQSGNGDQNSLTTFNQLQVTQNYSWAVSAPAVVDVYKPNAYLIIPQPLGQEIIVKQLLLGDPASIAAYIFNTADDDNDGIPNICDVDSNPGAPDFDNDGIVDSSTCDTQIGPPTNKDQCKNGGWEMFNFPRTFKNQGDCIQFINTGR